MGHTCRILLIMGLRLVIGRQWPIVRMHMTIFRYILALIVAVPTGGIVRKSGIWASYLLRILRVLPRDRLKEVEYEG